MFFYYLLPTYLYEREYKGISNSVRQKNPLEVPHGGFRREQVQFILTCSEIHKLNTLSGCRPLFGGQVIGHSEIRPSSRPKPTLEMGAPPTFDVSTLGDKS